MTPQPGRVQLRRTRGLRKPDRAVVVSRPSRWVVDLYRRGLECWRPLDGPCHADVLLEVANRR